MQSEEQPFVHDRVTVLGNQSAAAVDQLRDDAYRKGFRGVYLYDDKQRIVQIVPQALIQQVFEQFSETLDPLPIIAWARKVPAKGDVTINDLNVANIFASAVAFMRREMHRRQ